MNITADYPFYVYSECRTYGSVAAKFTQCTKFIDPRNVTYAYFVTNKVKIEQKMITKSKLVYFYNQYNSILDGGNRKSLHKPRWNWPRNG